MPENGSIHVVVLGAGFGGLTLCKHLNHPNVRITVVDRTNHHLFQPLLYQVAMAGLSAPDVAQPVRSILSKKPRLEVLMDTAKTVDLNAKVVRCERSELHYDYLVLALGSITSYFGHPEWEQFAPGLKTLQDALRIRRNVLLAFERAETESNPGEQARLMTMVVIGGGPTGVEVAGSCAELAHRVLRRDFDRIDPRKTRIILVEGGDRVLSHFAPKLSTKAKAQLEKLGVEVRTGCRVETITEGKVCLKDSQPILAENIIWAAGVMANPLTKTLGVTTDRGGRVKVEPDLTIPRHPEVYAIGDIAEIMKEDGQPVPGVAPAAMQMARYVAEAIEKRVQSGSSTVIEPFRYRDKGTLATIGRSAAVAQIGKLELSGFVAWVGWLLVHLVFLVGLRNKIAVFFSWVYSYLTYRLGARIIT